MNIKLDIKSIVILILLGFSIIFFGMWFFKGSGTKSEIKKLQDEIKSIELVRDSLKGANTKLSIAFNDLGQIIIERDKKIAQIESDLVRTKQDLTVANIKVSQNQKALAETKKKIEELRKNPINREDDALINSLKEKLK